MTTAMTISQTVRALLAEPRGDTRVAVVGANDDPRRFGCKISHDLINKGFDVVPVSPHKGTICGRPAYGTVADVPEALHIIDFVVPPPVSLKVIAALPKTDAVLWFQPGTFDAEVVAAAEATGAEVIAGPCIMVEARW